jgi:murein L,D-transpeptidase YcbB/YkuD
VLATRKTRTIHLDEPLAVYVIYWTAMALADGTVQFFEDVYGRDKVVLEELRKAPTIDIPTLASR